VGKGHASAVSLCRAAYALPIQARRVFLRNWTVAPPLLVGAQRDANRCEGGREGTHTCGHWANSHDSVSTSRSEQRSQPVAGTEIVRVRSLEPTPQPAVLLHVVQLEYTEYSLVWHAPPPVRSSARV
jgi:hypothetical protein